MPKSLDPTDPCCDLVSPAPEWFRWALDVPLESHSVEVEGCPIHYLLWSPREVGPIAHPDLLFVHGGGSHANWWRWIAPFFSREATVAAIDLSGMGNSGRRDEYGADIRAREIRAVIADAGLRPKPYVVGHSFGGYMTMRFGAEFGDEVAGAVIVDSAVQSPEDAARQPLRRPDMAATRIYESFEDAVSRFRLMPPQSYENDYAVEFIARHSVMPDEDGWTWKFDPEAMGARRFGEPFHEHIQAMRCRTALLYGSHSALVSRDTARFMAGLLGPAAPVIEIPEAQHHVMIDQPLAFVGALRTLLDLWQRTGG